MILKIQISQNDGGQHTLIYNQDKSVYHRFGISKEVECWMGGAREGYFNAEFQGDKIKILSRAPVQDW